MRRTEADCYAAPAVEVSVEMQIIMLPSLKGLCSNHIILFQSKSTATHLAMTLCYSHLRLTTLKIIYS